MDGPNGFYILTIRCYRKLNADLIDCALTHEETNSLFTYQLNLHVYK